MNYFVPISGDLDRFKLHGSLELTCFNFLVQAFGTPYSFWLTYSRILNSVFFSCFSRKFKKSSQTFQAYFPPSLGFEGERKSQNWIWMSNADKDSITTKIHDKKCFPFFLSSFFEGKKGYFGTYGSLEREIQKGPKYIRGQFHQNVYVQLLHSQIPKAQKAA